MLKKRKYYIVAAAFIVVVGGLFFARKYTAVKSAAPQAAGAPAAAGPQNQGGENPDSYVQAFRVKRIAFQDVLQGLTGTVRGSSVELKSFQDERLLRYRFKPGDKLKKGDVIAELDHTRALARLNQAEIELERKSKLLAVGGASKMELQQAKESYTIAKKDYDDTFITAPKEGYLGETLTQEGELVSRQSPIAYFVSSADPYFIETSIIEKRVSSISGGQKAVVTIDGAPIEGTVMSVSPEVLTTSRMAPVRIALPNEYARKLRPGMSASCDVVIYSKNSLVIPMSSLVEGKEKVYVIDAEKHAYAKEVTTGYRSRDYVEITGGLAEGDVVVVNADYAGIADGAKVRYSEIQEYKEESK